MKQGKRIVSLILALVMICGLMVNASAAEAQEIKAQLSYDIVVSYNGEAQTLTDAAGNIVYPISYNGTTYLPVRAVSYVLGIAVDWDGTTQTVLLSDGEAAAPKAVPANDAPSGLKDITAQLNPGITVQYNGETKTMTDAAGNTVYPVSYEGTTYLPVRAVSNMLGVEVDWDGATQTVLLNTPKTSNDTTTIIGLGGDGTASTTVGKNDVLRGIQTTENAEILGENHIGGEWTEIDWSTATDSYIRVIVHELPGPSAYISTRLMWNDNGKCQYSDYYKLTEGEWNIPLYAGNTEYALTTSLSFVACEHYMTDEELTADADRNTVRTLNARFTAKIENPDNVWLLSTPFVDFANAPETCAKALEITKNCKNDAEKITAIFNWVAKNIKYDNKEANRASKKSTDEIIYCFEDEENGTHTLPPDKDTVGYTDQNRLDLDLILSKKTGICAHQATLVAGMLRSIGVPCQLVDGRIKENGEEFNHQWVAVKPETGTLNRNALGAGNDYESIPIGRVAEQTGWTRLDPTNGLKNPTYTKNDKNYIATVHK